LAKVKRTRLLQCQIELDFVKLVGPDKIQEDDEDENGVSARTISELFCFTQRELAYLELIPN